MDGKTLIGALLALVVVVVLLIAGVLVYTGLRGAGSGEIKFVIPDVVEITGINARLVMVIAGAMVAVLCLSYVGKVYIEFARSKGGFTDFIRDFTPSRQRLSGRVLIPCPRGQSECMEDVLFRIAFPSTPEISLEVDSKYEPLKRWPRNVSTTGFGIVLNKEDGFTGEEILVKWTAVEKF